MTDRGFVFPEVEFASHPYYAPLASEITASERAETLAKFMDVYSGIVAQQKTHAQYRRAHPEEGADPSPASEALDKEGILAIRLEAADLEAIGDAIRPVESALKEQRDQTPPERRAVGAASMKVCDRGDNSPQLGLFQSLLQKYGILDACRRHKKLPYTLKFVMLQHNTSEDLGLNSICSYEDRTRAKTFYTHIDTSIDAMKVIIYVTPDVVAERGAFRYFPGSHAASSLIDLAIRKSNDKCGWENVHKLHQRRAFASLPREFQKKANFGNDLLDDEVADSVLRHERILDSSGGDLLLFNPDGAHRGAIFTAPGERKILQLLLIPDLSAK